MVAKLTADEFTALLENTCPDCRGFIFRPGPRGGLSQNIECAGCRSRFNVVRYKSGDLLTAQRIDNDIEWPEILYPQVLG